MCEKSTWSPWTVLVCLLAALVAAGCAPKPGLPKLAERVLVSQEGDGERLAKSACKDPRLKRGLAESGIHPYNLESGGDNLLSSSLWSRLRMGELIEQWRKERKEWGAGYKAPVRPE